MPPALDLVPCERRVCDSIRYFRACTERRSGPRAGGGWQATEQQQVSFAQQWLDSKCEWRHELGMETAPVTELNL